MNLKFFFLKHCKDNNFEINENKIAIISDLNKYYLDNFNQILLTKIFKKKKKSRILSCWRCRSWKNNDS